MIEWMPGQQGWTDRGPRLETTLSVDSGKLPATWPPGNREVAEIEKQGRRNPRRLTLLESRIAELNRRVAWEDLLAMETWYDTQIKTAVKKKR